MKIDKEKYIDTGLISEVLHETEPFAIYNYTKQCQYSGKWDEITMQCRGLILNHVTGEVVARPFKKFFNYEEHLAKNMPIPSGIPIVYDKRDGSLGILYWGLNGLPYIATRGSFYSEQAIWATKWFREHARFTDYERDWTYLFEIIYPENRIVVDYKGYSGLDLLAVIDTKNGYEILDVDGEDGSILGTPIRAMRFTSFEELKNRNEKNSEGFVLHWPEHSLRLKIKFDEYVRLHKIITGLSEKGLWEMLSSGKDLDEILSGIPEEMLDWAKGVCYNLMSEFDAFETEALSIYKDVIDMKTRKEQASFIVENASYPGIVFAMLDRKNYKKIIWSIVKPRGLQTFRRDLDA